MMRKCDHCEQHVDDACEGILNDCGEFLCEDCQAESDYYDGPPKIEPWPEFSIIKNELAVIVPKAQRDLGRLKRIIRGASARIAEIRSILRDSAAQVKAARQEERARIREKEVQPLVDLIKSTEWYGSAMRRAKKVLAAVEAEQRRTPCT